MAQGEGFTSRQKEFLAVVLQTPYILQRFYLTGGTALSYWYLHHRQSQDIDLFSEQEVNTQHLIRWLATNKKQIGFASLAHKQEFGFNTFHLTYPEGYILKVEFSFFPSQRIERGIVWKGLQIDSIYDIAVNKLNIIGSSPRGRDYVDLFLILKDNKWTLEKLRRDSAVKHGIVIEEIQLAKQFLKVSEFTDMPKMLVPFNQKEMEEFFLKLAKSLEKDIFK